MSYIDRGLMVLLSLLSVCGAVVLFLLGLQVFGVDTINSMLSYPGNVVVIVVAIVWFLLALRFLFYRTSRMDSDHVVLPGDHGSIRISFEAIRQLSNRTGKAVRGVQEFDTRVRTGQAGVWLAVRVKALPDTDLSGMSKTIQEEVKTYVEQTTGVSVERITVNIAELASTPARASKAWVD